MMKKRPTQLNYNYKPYFALYYTYTYVRRYLNDHLPPPSTIPVTVKLTVPKKGFESGEVRLRPEESMESVLKRLRSLMEEKGLSVGVFPPCEELVVSIIR